MTNVNIKTKCSKCNFCIAQDIISESPENYIYCQACDNVFLYKPQNEPIQNNLIYENMEKAYNEIPHTLIKTEAIFLKGHINGYEINFLLDTGAEMSIIPANIIEACNLDSIMDKNYQGTMKGVGEAKILGRVHYIEIILECGIYPCAFTVCSNNNLPPILGIDMMYNLGISIDFKKKQIHFGDSCSIPFINK